MEWSARQTVSTSSSVRFSEKPHSFVLRKALFLQIANGCDYCIVGRFGVGHILNYITDESWLDILYCLHDSLFSMIEHRLLFWFSIHKNCILFTI